MTDEQWDATKLRIDELIQAHGPSGSPQWDALVKDILPKVRADGDRLRAALRWYADTACYASIGAGKPPILRDSGRRARHALSESL